MLAPVNYSYTMKNHIDNTFLCEDFVVDIYKSFFVACKFEFFLIFYHDSYDYNNL